MLDLSRPFVLKNHAVVRGIIVALTAVEEIPQTRLFAVLGELQWLKKHAFEKESVPLFTVDVLCTEVQERLARASRSQQQISDQEKENLIATCDEIRLHLLASALARSIVMPAEPQRRPLVASFEDGSVGPVIHGKGGVTHAVVGDVRIVILPKVRYDKQCDEIYEEMMDIVDDPTAIEKWLVDFSLMESVPLLLLANLIVCSKKLRVFGNDLYLCWVKPGFFSETQLPRIVQYFNMQLVGGYYFSTSADQRAG